MRTHPLTSGCAALPLNHTARHDRRASVCRWRSTYAPRRAPHQSGQPPTVKAVETAPVTRTRCLAALRGCVQPQTGTARMGERRAGRECQTAWRGRWSPCDPPYVLIKHKLSGSDPFLICNSSP